MDAPLRLIAANPLDQLAKTVEDALADQRKHILREFSLDQKDSALSRLVAEFSLDDDACLRPGRIDVALFHAVGFEDVVLSGDDYAPGERILDGKNRGQRLGYNLNRAP